MHGHDARSETTREFVAHESTVEGVVVGGSNLVSMEVDARSNKPFWRDRPTLVTGATGLLGGWLVRQLLAAEADVVCLVRDWVPQSEFVRARLIDRVKVVNG